MANIILNGKTVVTQTGNDEPVLGSNVILTNDSLANATFPAGHVVQTKHKIFTTALGYNTNQTERIPISGFYEDLTPKYTNSLILAQAHLAVGFSSTPEWS